MTAIDPQKSNARRATKGSPVTRREAPPPCCIAFLGIHKLRSGLALLLVSLACGADWPQWKAGADRAGSTTEALPGQMALAWSLTLPAPQPAWPASQPWLRYDESYAPVAARGKLFVPSMVTDCVTAYRLDDGKLLWRFHADGPVRFAPAYANDRVYFGSDDGFLYCLAADVGKLLWKVRGGPGPRRVLGNQRIISTWPVRTGPVVADGQVYFAAGIWPFMGIFVHAVDAKSGKVLWTNSGEGAVYQLQPHNSPAFSGFAPHGYLSIAGDRLVAAGGRTQPGCFDRQTGKLLNFEFGPKNTGAWEIVTRSNCYLTGDRMLNLADGKARLDCRATLADADTLYALFEQKPPVETKSTSSADEDDDEKKSDSTKKSASKTAKTNNKDSKAATTTKAATTETKTSAKVEPREVLPPGRYLLAQGAVPTEKITHHVSAEGKKTFTRKMILPERWQIKLPADGPDRLLAKANDQFILGAGSELLLAKVVAGAAPRLEIDWRRRLDSAPWAALVADGRLVVVSQRGVVWCFDAQGRPGAVEAQPAQAVAENQGYGLLLGLGDDANVEALLARSSLHWVAIEADAARVAAARRHFGDKGLYGTRLAILAACPLNAALPAYFATEVVVNRPAKATRNDAVALVKVAFRSTRPYGGRATIADASVATVGGLVRAAELEGCRVEASEGGVALHRDGPPPGAGQWTHQYADAGNTVFSPDKLVKAPMGLLWFGGPSNDDVLPRHGHGPAPQSVAGRLFIEGPDMLRAIDIYTGRLLWQQALPGLGKFYDNTKHQPGANEIGSNYVSQADAVYVVRGEKVLALDAANGTLARQFSLGVAGKDYGGYLGVLDRYLAVTVHADPYAAASNRLIVFDRQTGRKLWERPARYAFRHNNLAMGGKRLYCIDSHSAATLDRLRRRGESPDTMPDYKPRLLALDLATGREAWSTDRDVFGTFLSYSSEFDVLLQGASFSRDRAADEAKGGMVAYQGAGGRVLWKDLERKYNGPCMLRHDTIITQRYAYHLLTGQQSMRQEPLCSQTVPWEFMRNYGCNTAIASENLLTFRSAAAGFYDLAGDSGTGNFGGFKSSCTSNLIAAGGLLCAPEYTRTCICRYQNQTSLAMIHDPDVEMWTFNTVKWTGRPIARVGVNFGAPGDRLDHGTLWLDYPIGVSPSPQVPIEVQPATVSYFRHHSGLVEATAEPGSLPWVAASGVRGVELVKLRLSEEPQPPKRKYTVTLHFAEWDDAHPGQRVFRVHLPGLPPSEPIDIARAVGPRRALVKVFAHVEVAGTLEVRFESQSQREPVLCGLEAVAE